MKIWQASLVVVIQYLRRMDRQIYQHLRIKYNESSAGVSLECPTPT